MAPSAAEDVLSFLQARDVPQGMGAFLSSGAPRALPATYPFHLYGFPPALLPLWNVDLTYTGVWEHLLVPRPAVFVQCKVNYGYFAVEYARSTEQLEARLLFEDLDEVDGLAGMSAAGESLRGLLRDEVVGDVASALERAGQVPEALTDVAVFAQDPPGPIVRFDARYRGDFPSRRPSNALTCGLEYPAGPWAPDWPVPPEDTRDTPWLRAETDKSSLFDRFLEDGDLGKAWLTLNSRGWTFARARQAFQRLADVSGDPIAAERYRLWSAFRHEHRNGGY
jgi:hypothetical protein